MDEELEKRVLEALAKMDSGQREEFFKTLRSWYCLECGDEQGRYCCPCMNDG